MKKLMLTIILALTFVTLAKAQDIIIKIDQGEIKANVLEIKEDKIKYKLSEHQDGPTYNIEKREVFMIIYQNGKRETFTSKNPTALTQTPTTANTSTQTANPPTTSINSPPPVSLGTYLTVATNVEALGNGVLNLTVLSEGTNTIPSAGNYLRTGISTTLSAASGVYAQALLMHLTPHLPINRLTGNYDKQYIGLFPYLRLGAGAGYTRVTDSDSVTTWSFSHQIALGVDSFFSRRFGITAYSDKFQTFSAGVSLKF